MPLVYIFSVIIVGFYFKFHYKVIKWHFISPLVTYVIVTLVYSDICFIAYTFKGCIVKVNQHRDGVLLHFRGYRGHNNVAKK